MGWLVRKLSGSPTPVEAEASAARFAILMARAKGWSHIHLKGDCLQVVNALNDGDTQGLRSFDSIISTSIGLSSGFSAFICSFVRRSSNCLAHAFAHFCTPDSGYVEGVSLSRRFGSFDMI